LKQRWEATKGQNSAKHQLKIRRKRREKHLPNSRQKHTHTLADTRTRGQPISDFCISSFFPFSSSFTSQKQAEFERKKWGSEPGENRAAKEANWGTERFTDIKQTMGPEASDLQSF